jgi:hypothetical protein
MAAFQCSVCNEYYPDVSGQGVSTGYGCLENGDKVCYACCAIQDKQWMKEHNNITLYLTLPHPLKPGQYIRGHIGNWPSTLTYPAQIKAGNHNIAGVQYSVRFIDDTGQQWYGRQAGNNTQLCHCKKIRERK